MRLDEDNLDAVTRFERDLAATCSNVWGGVRKEEKGAIHSLYFRRRVGGVWIAVAKRYNPKTDAPEVCFGNGNSIVKALVGLNASLSAGKWMIDRPWSPGH
jgi:hypothetical protein